MLQIFIVRIQYLQMLFVSIHSINFKIIKLNNLVAQDKNEILF